ncbi:hypothetical protein C8Q80DRAFT_1120054 [Daedaleopsis nitida]|nr:hypothetical protein C8Q80DRAFT_1120054 [Daedaleopsis nitida]
MQKQGHFGHRDILPIDYCLLADSAYDLAIIDKDSLVSTPQPSILSHLLLPLSPLHISAAITTATMPKGPEDKRLEMALYIAHQSMAQEDRIIKAKKQRLTERTTKHVDEQHFTQVHMLYKKASRCNRHRCKKSWARRPSLGPSGRGRDASKAKEEVMANPPAVEDIEMEDKDNPAGNGNTSTW